MKKYFFLTALAIVLTACSSFLSPYQITFRAVEDDVIDPNEDTLDLIINSPALAYVSGYKCDDGLAVTLLPVLTDDMIESNDQSLSLAFLADQKHGAHCEINVTALDRSTTSTSRSKISLYLYEKTDAFAAEGERCAGIAGIKCEDGSECKLAGDYPDAGGACEKKSDEVNVKLQEELDNISAEVETETIAIEEKTENEESVKIEKEEESTGGVDMPEQTSVPTETPAQ